MSPYPAVARLRAHVEMLAGTIGERNLWSYGALEQAAQYISTQLTASGYTPRRQTFELAKLPLSNIEAILHGTTPRPGTRCGGALFCGGFGLPRAHTPTRNATAPPGRRRGGAGMSCGHG